MITKQEINDAYEDLVGAKREYTRAALRYAEAKHSLDIAIANDIVSGAIAGKNDTERNAAARSRYEASFVHLAKLEDTMNREKLSLDLAQIEEERVSKLLRLYELVGRQKDSVENNLELFEAAFGDTRGA